MFSDDHTFGLPHSMNGVAPAVIPRRSWSSPRLSKFTISSYRLTIWIWIDIWDHLGSLPQTHGLFRFQFSRAFNQSIAFLDQFLWDTRPPLWSSTSCCWRLVGWGWRPRSKAPVMVPAEIIGDGTMTIKHNHNVCIVIYTYIHVMSCYYMLLL